MNLKYILLCWLIVGSTASGQLEGPPPVPSYIGNAKVRATYTYAQAAWVEIQSLRQALEEARASPPPASPVQPLGWPSHARVVWRWVEVPPEPGRDAYDSVYLWEVTPIDQATWDASVSLGPIVVAPTLPPEPSTSAPVVYKATEHAAWGEPTATEWKAHGSPRPSAEDSVGWFAPGNWLEYATPTGSWTKVVLLVSNPAPGAEITVQHGGNSVQATVPATGSFSTFREVRVALPVTGPGVLRLTGSKGSDVYWVGDLKQVRIEP